MRGGWASLCNWGRSSLVSHRDRLKSRISTALEGPDLADVNCSHGAHCAAEADKPQEALLSGSRGPSVAGIIAPIQSLRVARPHVFSLLLNPSV